MKVIHWIAMILLIIGGLNWGLVGLFQIDVVAGIFGGVTAPLSRVVYVLVGLAAIWAIFCFFRMLAHCDTCKKK